jgi:small subunit ribosomal protein S16
MLVIRMQRTGRKGHAMFRVIVQDSRRTPTSGKIVASLGSYDPHSKAVVLNKEKAQFYLDHGAQPSDRVALLLKTEGIKLPEWVTTATKKERKLRNPEKLRRNRPPEAAAPAEPAAEPSEAPAEETAAEPAEADSTETVEAPAAEKAPAEETAEPETSAEAEAGEAPASEPEKAAEEPTAEPKTEPVSEKDSEKKPE